MNLTDYLDRARDRAGIPSDRRLAAALGVAPNAVVAYRRAIATPGPAVMLRLAQLAGIAPEVALLHRASWQADDQVSRDVVSRMLALFMGETAANPLNEPKSLGAAATPRKDKNLPPSIYYGKGRRWISMLIEWVTAVPSCQRQHGNCNTFAMLDVP